ncbi:MAG TPA: ABC transporter ATP-binding protein [Acidimicrobiia bacterium]|nr:ABC transporter ATP-binding protein [Acidimicrobiia bacterium]
MGLALEITGVSKSFGALKVIDDLSVTLGEGEALGIVGPNGAGKTTLFNLITGSIPLDSGTIRFDQSAIVAQAPYLRVRRGLGRTYQIPRPFGGMTVFENVLVAASYGSSQGETGGHERCVEILASTGLLAKANTLAGTLTILERKRLELARALGTGPTVLLLDEIAGGLTDPEVEELVVLIKSIHNSGMSIVWIEHLLHALVAVVDRVQAIHFGRHLIEGNPEEIINSPEMREVYLGIEE